MLQEPSYDKVNSRSKHASILPRVEQLNDPCYGGASAWLVDRGIGFPHGREGDRRLSVLMHAILSPLLQMDNFVVEDGVSP